VLDEATTRYVYDIALVLREPTDVAAAQQVRRSRHGRGDLPDRLRDVAHRLGQQAQAGELALFAGAGIGAAAGLPTWRQLVQELAELCALDSPLREGLSSLPPQDAAVLLARELGQELVTTNYDPLLEQAAAGAGRDLRVLPFDLAVPGHPWLHEGHYRAALSGVMHTLLLTRHVLFVGASMLDDDLIRIAYEVRRALQAPGPRAPRRSGTVLSLTHDPARARLWERDVETVAMSGRDTSSAEAARELEVLLDLLGCRACPPTGYLLDPALSRHARRRRGGTGEGAAPAGRADGCRCTPDVGLGAARGRAAPAGRPGQPVTAACTDSAQWSDTASRRTSPGDVAATPRPRMWSICSAGASAGYVAPAASGSSAVTRAAAAGPRFRSPISTSGPLPRSERTSRRSCTRFHHGMNDRWVHATVRAPPGAATCATTATRGSSRTTTGRRRPGKSTGTAGRSTGSRTTRHPVTG
jgi:hypothetical protein